MLAKGNYFGFAGRPVFSRLIYPTPVDGGLGVHVTLDLAGRMRFGPDVEWIDRGELYRRSAPRAIPSMSASAPIGPACPMDRWCRTIAASGRSSPVRASQPADFHDRRPNRRTACPGSSICSASNRRGSPRRCRLREDVVSYL